MSWVRRCALLSGESVWGCKRCARVSVVSKVVMIWRVWCVVSSSYVLLVLCVVFVCVLLVCSWMVVLSQCIRIVVQHVVYA